MEYEIDLATYLDVVDFRVAGEPAEALLQVQIHLEERGHVQPHHRKMLERAVSRRAAELRPSVRALSAQGQVPRGGRFLRSLALNSILDEACDRLQQRWNERSAGDGSP